MSLSWTRSLKKQKDRTSSQVPFVCMTIRSMWQFPMREVSSVINVYLCTVSQSSFTSHWESSSFPVVSRLERRWRPSLDTDLIASYQQGRISIINKLLKLYDIKTVETLPWVFCTCQCETRGDTQWPSPHRAGPSLPARCRSSAASVRCLWRLQQNFQ